MRADAATPPLQAIVRVDTNTGTQNLVAITPDYNYCQCTALLVSPDGKTLYTSYDDATTVIVRNAETGEKIREISLQHSISAGTVDYTFPFSLSPDGSLLLVGTCGDVDIDTNECIYGVLEVYDSASGSLLGMANLGDYSEEVITNVVATPDNRTAYVTDVFEYYGSPPQPRSPRPPTVPVTDGITAISLTTFSPVGNLNIEPSTTPLVASGYLGYSVTPAGLAEISLPSLKILRSNQEQNQALALADHGAILCAYGFNSVDCYRSGSLALIGTFTNDDLESEGFDEGGFAGDPTQPYVYVGGNSNHTQAVLYKIDAQTLAVAGMFPTAPWIESIAAAGDGIVYTIIDNY